jgi:hypothetical protein
MRRMALLFCILTVLPLAAQERELRTFRMPAEWHVALPAYEKRVQELTAGIKRDAFIVSRVTVAMADLTEEFQKLSAIQKAYDRIGEAVLRAGQDPRVSPQTLTALSKMEEALRKGREQGSMADTEALRALLLKEGRVIQRELYRGLGIARGERQNLTDLLNRVQTMNGDLEGAMIEALGSTFDFLGAGGR